MLAPAEGGCASGECAGPCAGDASPGKACCVDAYFDDDGDGYGASYAGCLARPGLGLASNDLDCDDARTDVHPGLLEVCDGAVDNDCDGFADPCGASSHRSLVPGDLEIVRVRDRMAGMPDWLGEWFEIANRTGRPVELMGLEVRDDGVDGFTIRRSLVLEPGGHAILGRNGDVRTNGDVPVAYVYSDFVLSNAGDSIELRSDGIAIDRIVYASEGDLIPDLLPPAR